MRFNQIVETTTAGSVATVAQPMMTQTRENINVPGLKPVQQLMKGKSKKKGPYANSINEGKVKQLTIDLTELTDEEFKKKYGKTKVEIRSDMKKVNEDDLAEQDLIVIPGQGRLRRTGFVKQDLDQGEHEGHTLKNSLHTIARAASDLDKRLSVQSEFPEWVSEKIGAAKGMMVTVMDYLISSQEMQHDTDSMAEDMSNTDYTPQVGEEILWRSRNPMNKMMPVPGTVLAIAPGKVTIKIKSPRLIQNIGKDTIVLNLSDYVLMPKQGVAEGNRPFRGVGGAFNRGDDERHDLDPTDWYIVKDGEMFVASIYPKHVQQAISQGFSRTQAEAQARVDSQGVANGSLNELSSGLLQRAAQAATDKSNQAMDPELHNALGGGYMNPLATHYDNVSQKINNRAGQVRKKETIQKIASKIASPAVMRKMGMADQGVAEDDSALQAFLSKGGTVQQLPYKKPRKADKTDYGSRHIGGSGDKMKASRTGTAARTQGNKVAGIGEAFDLDDLRKAAASSRSPEDNAAHKRNPDFGKLMQKSVNKHNKAVVKTRQDIGSRIADIGAGGKEYNVKTDAAWDAAKKKVSEDSKQ